MRLFLASQDFGNHVGVLRQLVGNNDRALIILNAKDDKLAEQRQIKLSEKKTQLESNGFSAVELDLREYFGDIDALRKRLELEKPGLIYVAGGNVFLLRKAFHQSGFDTILQEALNNDAFVYAGSSAGSIVLGPSLKYYDREDKSDVVVDGYQAEVIWNGLNSIPEHISPHTDTPGHEQVSQDRRNQFEHDDALYVELNDSDVLVVDGEEQTLLK